MFCYKCGCNNPDENRYCSGCGSELKVMRQPSAVQNQIPQAPVQNQVPPSPAQNQVPPPPVQNPNPYGGQADNYQQQNYYGQPQDPGYYGQPPVMPNPYTNYGVSSNPAKNIFSGTLYMVSIIGYTASILLTMLLTITGRNSIVATLMTTVNRLYSMGLIDFNELGISPYEFMTVLSRLNSTSTAARIGSAIGSALIPGLIALAFWLIFASAKNKNSQNMTSGGFTILKVLATIQLVLSILGCIIVEIILFIAGFQLSKYATRYGEKSPMVYFVVAMVIVLIVFAIQFLYLAKLIKTIGSLRDAGVSGNPTAYVSTFVAVVFIISFVGNVFSVLTALLNPLTALPIIGTAVYSITMGIFLFKANGLLKSA